MAERPDVIEAIRAQDLNAARFLGRPDVAGIATGYRQRKGQYGDQVCVQLFVPQKLPRDALPEDALLPPEVHGPDGERVPTDVIEAGPFQPLQDTTRYRPVVGGCSIGNMTGFNAGTLGGIVCDETDHTAVLLTNNHVLTVAGARQTIPADDRIVQPGRLDGGVAPADVIGDTKRLVPIPTGPVRATAPVTAVDAAIGSLDADYRVRVLNIGSAPFETGAAALGMNVQKRGRTTQLTTNGQVVSVNASWTLNYGTMASPVFATIGTGGSVFNIASTDGNPFGRRGDSGSLIFDQAEGDLNDTFPCVGLLFAGGSNGTGQPFGTLIGACDIGSVFAGLNLGTMCTCIVRSLLDAIGQRSAEDETTEARMIDPRKTETRLRRLEQRLFTRSEAGGAIVELVRKNAPLLSDALAEDEEAFALAVRAFDPLVRKAASFELLDAELDLETIAPLGRLADRLIELRPELEKRIRPAAKRVLEAEGTDVREFLGKLKRPESPGGGKKSGGRKAGKKKSGK